MSEPARARTAPGLVTVVIPTYNEAENIGPIVTRLRAAVPDATVLIVDDGSPDGTGAIADALAAGDAAVSVLHRAEKEGLGAAYLAGFDRALQCGADVVVEMDADGSHAPEELRRLLTALDAADLVIGSRWIPGGTVVDWPRSRLLLSRGANVYTRIALRMPISDATGGYRAYRAGVLRSLKLSGVASAGYCFQVDLARRAFRAGFRVLEVPITFVERERGVSKMSRAIVTEAFWRVTWWGAVDVISRLRAARPGGRQRQVARLTRPSIFAHPALQLAKPPVEVDGQRSVDGEGED